MAKKPKLKIGFVFDDSLDSYDGVAQYVKALGGWMSAQGHDVKYLVGETKAKQWKNGQIFSLAKNIKVSFNGNKASIPLPSGRQKIKHILRAEKFDVLHIQMPYSPFMAQQVIKYAGPDTVIVGTFHVVPANSVANFGSKLLGVFQRNSLKRFDEIFSVSSAAADFARSAFGIKPAISPNVIELSRFNKAKQRKHFVKPHKILFFGRLVKRKGCRELILAYSELLRSDINTKLVIAGDGPQRQELQKLVNDLGLKSEISFEGFIEEDKKADLLADADIACFPSLYGESFGIVLLEAMAAGSGLVLGGNNIGYSTVLGEQPKLLIDPRKTKEFAGRLDELLKDRQVANQLHQWQQNEVKKYDIDIVAADLLRRYYSAIDKRIKNRHN